MLAVGPQQHLPPLSPNTTPIVTQPTLELPADMFILPARWQMLQGQGTAVLSLLGPLLSVSDTQ